MYVNPRTAFVSKHIQNKNARILELGPLNYPVLTKEVYTNCRYCDIRTTEEVKKLYSGNSYLETTGITVDTDSIIDIDDVIVGTYTDTYANKEKFDSIIASHVMEHMHDIIFSLQDIAGIMKPNGTFFIAYPDKRYCFDHFRQSASFRDAYFTNKYGKEQNARMVLDFAFSAIDENDPSRFWSGENLEHLLPLNNIAKAIEQCEDALNGVMPEDVHYWPFTDYDFLLFLYDGTRAGMVPFTCIDFIPTDENTQQFMVALRYTPDTMNAPERALRDLPFWISRALPSYYCSKDISLKAYSQEQMIELQKIKVENAEYETKIIDLQQNILQKQECVIQSQENSIQLKMQMEAALVEKQSQLDHTLAEKQIQMDEAIREKQSEIEIEIKKQQVLQSTISGLNDQLERVNIQVENLNYYVEAFQQSRSWKITKPLRALARIFKQDSKDNGGSPYV